MREIVCGECGVVFQAAQYGPLPTRCKGCQAEYIKARQRAWWLARKNAEQGERPELLHCLDCGAVFEKSGRKVRCTPCATARNKMVAAAANKRRKAREHKKARPKSPQLPRLTITQTVAQARAAGMTYGQYVAAHNIQ